MAATPLIPPTAHRITSPAELEFIQQGTRAGVWDLSLGERWWRDRFEYLKDRGYTLRPRFRPDWRPSWLGTDLNPFDCEDSKGLVSTRWIDATRASDGKIVALKRVKRGNNEVSIARALSSKDNLENPDNHCVPILDYFDDVKDEAVGLLVMPLLLPYNHTPFAFIKEAVEFFRQTLRGLIFMHEQNVAHRDLTGLNIMMDGYSLYPKGFHPSYQSLDPTATELSEPIFRRDAQELKYYIIDFGISSSFNEFQSRSVTGTDGLDQDVPELSNWKSYDPFPVDVFTLGNVFKKEFIQLFNNLEFLSPLAQWMTLEDPSQRPSARQAFQRFEEITRGMKRYQLCRPLRPVGEDPIRLSLALKDAKSVMHEISVNISRSLCLLLPSGAGWLIPSWLRRFIPSRRRHQRSSS